MSIVGMYMLNTEQYNQEKIYQALNVLYADRKNQFHELSQVILSKKAIRSMPRWKEFILNFCLDVEKSFRIWTGKDTPLTNSPQKALTLLRQLGHDKISMNQLVHLLNISYNISLEFKEIYNGLK